MQSKNLSGDMNNASHRVPTVVPQRVIDDNEDSGLIVNLQLFVHLRRFVDQRERAFYGLLDL